MRMPMTTFYYLVEAAIRYQAWLDMRNLHVAHGDPEKVRDYLENEVGVSTEQQQLAVLPGVTPGVRAGDLPSPEEIRRRHEELKRRIRERANREKQRQ